MEVVVDKKSLWFVQSKSFWSFQALKDGFGLTDEVILGEKENLNMPRSVHSASDCWKCENEAGTFPDLM